MRIVLIQLVVLCFFEPRAISQPSAAQHPNIILIIADDLGYSDLASYGNRQIHTPYIDSLGVGGVRFTRAYVSSPICAPSRAGIMTGRYQNRFGSEFMPYPDFSQAFMKEMRSQYLPFHKKSPGLNNIHPRFTLNTGKYHTGLPPGEITIAELLRKNGYATAIVGKWNLGEEEGLYPADQGFDYSYYFSAALTRYVDDPVDHSRYIDQHLPWAFSELPAWQPRAASTAIHEGKVEVKDTGYLTFSLANKAVEFIEGRKDKPFFLTLSFNAPHDPFQVPINYFDKLSLVTDTLKRVYYGMIEALDDAVGTVMQKLRDLSLDRNTMVIFISDNGGATYTRATDNAPLRGGKCTHFEGGLEVPFFIWFPAGIQTNVYDKSVSSLDIFSTIAAFTGTGVPAERKYDGVNLLPFLSNNQAPHDIFYWRNGYSKAVLKQNWKLYVNEKDGKRFLFNLDTDRSEKNDLSATEPEKVKELLLDLELWEKNETVKPAWPSAADISIDVDGESFYFPG